MKLLYTCAPGRLGSLRVFLVIVGLQYVTVLGHHEDRDEVHHSESQKLGLLTVLLEQTTYTKRPVSVCLSSSECSDSWDISWVLCMLSYVCTTSECSWWASHNISEDDSPEAVNVHVLKQPVQVSDWRHPACHCINRTLHACTKIKPLAHVTVYKWSPKSTCTSTPIRLSSNPCALHGVG